MGPGLCQNRPEGLGPSSSLHPHLPTTCFLDVIVEPLATWIFLFFTLALILPRLARQRRNGRPLGAAAGVVKRTSPGGVIHRILSFLYYVLLVALLAMVSLELARLVAAQLGIGLLPFTYVGVVVALGNHIVAGARPPRLANGLYWILLATALALKTATEQAEQMGTSRRVKGQGVQGNYPTSDEALDNAVMVGVALVLAALEFAS